ncbi:hypothetical protein D3C72_2457500 [compost metagenome]
MELIEIDMIELHAPQALFGTVDDVISRAAARVNACRAGFTKDFGGDNHIFTRNFQVLQRLPGDDFRAPF